ncbi:MAG: hypothetical protein AB7G87_04840 [Clostridia bacterium]
MMKKNDIIRLRELAKQVREIAELPVQQTNIKLWQSVNDLKMIRPVVYTRDYPLYLIEYGNELATTIEDPELKRFELDLLLRIYEWKYLRCDRVIEPTIKCHVVVEDSMFGIQATATVSDTSFVQGKEYNQAKHFEPQIKTEDDLALIKAPVVYYDEEATMKKFHRMQEIFDGVLDVKLFGRTDFHNVLWDDLLTWMGLNEGMYNFALEPELMHKAAEIYTDSCISRAKQYESLGILSSNNAAVNVGHNGLGFTTQLPQPTESGIGAKLSDIWGQNSDQILTSVSPAMSEEFAFDHEKKWAELFSLHSYGCCERLDHKINELKAGFSNLRKISMSPYSNLEAGMEQIGSDYVVCFKPNSNYLVGKTWDKEYLRKELINACSLARKYNCNLEMDMKTLISLNGEPQRLWEWCDMAADIVSNY